MVEPLKSHQALEQIVPPAATPVSVAECKAHMRVDFTDDDAYIEALIGAAVGYFDGLGVLGKAMLTQQWRQYSGANPDTVRLSIGPVQTLNAVKYYDPDGVEQAASLSDFDVFGPGGAMTVSTKPGVSWPTAQQRPDAIWVEYTSGYGDAATDVPDAIRHAIKFTVAHWYENREPVAKGRMAELPIGVSALINTQRERWYG